MDSHVIQAAPSLCNESTPLLPSADASLLEEQLPVSTPLPKVPLAALCLVRLVDPIAFTQIFPYVNEFMSDLKVTDNPEQIGFYSGLVESAFSIAQLCSIYQWARLSDNIGRRPVILFGTFGIALTTLQFGFARSLAGVLVARCLAGLFSGNLAVIHSVLGELTDTTNQARALPVYGLCWPVGSIIGPLLGGALSHPASKLGVFDTPFWRSYPYVLPCAVAAAIAFIGAIGGYHFLDETLPTKRTHQKNFAVTLVKNNTDMIPYPTPTLRILLTLPAIRALCLSGAALSFLATAFDVVFVLFCYSPIASGGLGFSAWEIGTALALAGILAASLQLFLMPVLLRTCPCERVYVICMAMWPVAFAMMPLLGFITRDFDMNGMGEVGRVILWMAIGVALSLSKGACLAYSLSMILVKEHAPHPAALGASNGLVQFAMCLARAVSPAFVSSAFTLSVDSRPGGRHMWVVVMIVLSFCGCILSRGIGENKRRR